MKRLVTHVPQRPEVKTLGVSKREGLWEKPPSSAKKLNQHIMFESDNDFGLPEVGFIDPKSVPEFDGIVPFCDPRMTRGTADIRGSLAHFYVDDYRFESAWSSPERFLTRAGFVRGLITPDFSVFTEQPWAMNLWNTYRNRWLAVWLQSNNIPIIPSVNWAGRDTFEFCFSGLPRKSVLAVSTIGTWRKENRKLWEDGFDDLMHKLDPRKVYVYGETHPVDFQEYAAYFGAEFAFLGSSIRESRDRRNGNV